jgi:hypothetical protein
LFLQVQELVIDYTDCKTSAPENTPADISDRVSATFKASTADGKYLWKRSNGTDNSTVCSLYFHIPESMGPPVFLYYRLTNFYQNHRRYVQSLDLDQLKGTAVPNSTISGSVCSPLATDDATGKAYYPCGLIANSMFNDSISSPVLTADDPINYTMTKKGIAWDSDKALIKQTQYKPWEVVPPPNWKDYNGSYEKTGIPNLHENEDFMVWMRTAGLPSFSKLSRRNDDTAMGKGDYRLDIVDRTLNDSICRPFCCGRNVADQELEFPVSEYDGTKSILLSTRTVIGGKNPFMGIAYVVVGGVCVLLGALFTVAYLIRPRYVQLD